MAPYTHLLKRWSDDDGDDGFWWNSSSGWYEYGRWVVLAVIIGVCVVVFLLVQGISCRRARHGEAPIQGTAWMVPPSYYQSQQQHRQHQQHEDAVPMYKQEAGQGDAGHYDPDGNFVPYRGNNPVPDYSDYGPTYDPPRGQYTPISRTAQSNGDDRSTAPLAQLDQDEDFAVPPPPQAAATSEAVNYHNAPPPPGPPPNQRASAGPSNVRDFYRPVDPDAPEKAVSRY